MEDQKDKFNDNVKKLQKEVSNIFEKSIKVITEREYCPATIFYIPIWVYFTYLAIRAKSLMFFSNINPMMECSDFLDSSKIDSYKDLPQDLYPNTVFIKENTSIQAINDKLKTAKLEFPCIAKPNFGRRWIWIQPLHNQDELIEYFREHGEHQTILQEFLDRKIEVAVMYVRIPWEKGQVTGIMRRNFLTIIWDWESTIRELIEKHPRAERYLKVLKKMNKHQLNHIPTKWEKVKGMPVWSHCRGTQFLDASDLITPKIEERFDEIASHFKWRYNFGRYDIKLNKMSDLENWPIKILDINWAASEPAHAYDPKYNIIEWYKIFMWHRKQIFKIGQINQKKWIPYRTLKEFFALRKKRKSQQ